MRPDTISQQVKVSYPPEKLAEIAKNLAHAVAELETARNEKKVSDKAFSERFERHNGEITELAGSYNKAYEMEQVVCDIRYNAPENGKKEYIRMDTKEIIATLDMTWEEKQEELQLRITESPEPTADQITDTLDGIAKEDEPPEEAEGASA